MAPRLTVMYGASSPPMFIDPRGKSDFDAGLLFFATAARMYPGLSWRDLQRPEFMAGWWTDLKRAAGDVKDGVGDILKDTGNFIAKKGGETVRLATDPNVASSVTRAAAAYATGGASEAVPAAGSAFDQVKAALANIFTPTGREAVENAGAAYKRSMGVVDFGNPWVLGGTGAAALGLFLAFGGRRRRR